MSDKQMKDASEDFEQQNKDKNAQHTNVLFTLVKMVNGKSNLTS